MSRELILQTALLAFLLLYIRAKLFRRKRRGRRKSRYVIVGHNDNGKPIYQHRKFAEHALGRKLSYSEVVHHINFRKDDNRLENLCVMSAKNHDLFHDWYDSLAKRNMRPKQTTQRQKLVERYDGRISR